ncbi:MAG: SRPBCC family protein [Cyanobacteria bacterium REEB67]|nr:SRPBCC family protein [Cyanobacteria bacterium REEB67]
MSISKNSKANFTMKLLIAATIFSTCGLQNAVSAAPINEELNNSLPVSRLEEAKAVEGLQTPDGKNYQMTRAVVNASPEDVYAIIVDYKNSGRLFANLTKSQVVSRDEANGTSSVAFSLKGIMNLWSFDYVLSIKESYPNLIEFHRQSGAFKRNEGYWKLIPLDGGKATEVVYAKYVDAGPMIPPSLVAKEVRDSTASVMENLKKVAENPNPKLASHR